MTGSILIAGTTSDAGKSVVTTGLCRVLARRGLKVAPFKAQNMSNNSMVTAEGAEIGRAQWVQAIAAGAVPEAAMNPVLLKPGSDKRSHVVVMGRPHGSLSSRDFIGGRGELARAAFDAYDDLRSRYDVVVCEGAGSPAEINLRAHDYVNLGLAQHAAIPTVVVGDIDRGGVFASLFGTLAMVSAADQRLIAGFVINKFRGEVSLLRPGLDELERVTGRPVYGVLPWQPDLWLDSEDAASLVSIHGLRPHSTDQRNSEDAASLVSIHGLRPHSTDQRRRVAVVRLPRISNFTDIDALMLEPDLEVSFVSTASGLADADLVVLPGTRSTIEDLAWLRSTGLADAVVDHAARGGAVLGICGGFQMLGARINDPEGVEGKTGACVEGLGLLPVRTTFGADKQLRLPTGTALGVPASGYEIHHGRIEREAGDEFLGGASAAVGSEKTNVFGTMWHGCLEGDAFRRAFLSAVLGERATTVSFAAAREARIDAIADALEEHLDVDAVLRLIENGAPAGLPTITGGLA